MEDIMRIAKSYDDPGLLINSISHTIENETKEQMGGFLGMLLSRLDAN